MAEITLKEAKEFYNSSNEVKAFLLTKFTKDELEGKNIPTQEEFNKFFEDIILSSIDYSKTRFLTDNLRVSDTPTSIIEVRNLNHDWYFYYNYDSKNQYFKYSYDRVGRILMNKFSLSTSEFIQLMKNIVEIHFKLPNVTPGIGIE
jgi:hypothetical protein